MFKECKIMKNPFINLSLPLLIHHNIANFEITKDIFNSLKHFLHLRLNINLHYFIKYFRLHTVSGFFLININFQVIFDEL